MIKYLDLFEKDMKKHNADYFVEQIQLYKNMYTHYKNTSCPSPIYTGILNHGDTHCFYLYWTRRPSRSYAKAGMNRPAGVKTAHSCGHTSS